MRWEDTYGLLEQIKDKQRYGVFLSMGNGKTALLLALCDHKFFDGVCKVLIITPKQVSLSTWQDEIKKWENFNYMLPIVNLIDGDPREREKKLDETGMFCIHIISSSLTEWLYGNMVRKGKRNVWEKNPHTPMYDMVIVDECSQFKDATTHRFKALKNLNPKQLFLLSGTPFSNIIKEQNKGVTSYKQADELYYAFNLLNLYDKSLTQFRNEYCYTLPWDKYNYRMKEATYDALIQTLNQVCIRKTLELNVKKHEHKIYCNIDETRLKMLKGAFYIETFGCTRITAANTATMINKALQLSNGFVYDEMHGVARLNHYKFDTLLEVLVNNINDNIIIFYNFKEDKEYLLQNIPGARELINDKDIKEWNDGKIKYLILSPFSSKYGLNLQQGGHKIIWYGLVWSAESYEQANARLYRRGQTYDVDIYYLLSKDSFDDYVYDKLVLKLDVLNDFISYIGK